MKVGGSSSLKKEGMILAKLCHAHPPWSLKKNIPFCFSVFFSAERKDKGEGVLERGNPRLRGQITPSSLIQLGLVCSQRETLPHVFQFESHPVFSMSSSLSGGRHSSIAFITEGPNPKNKSIKRLDLSDLTIVSLGARST
ncbi:hypothetical protein (mitochondrion) [Glycine soja]|uniref:Uncharacterized protein n=1 Tax=Glycine soja TaxID=3848 RepID=A0A386JNI6_GLYSO|nr:hypothetical protein [Glycine soja]AYD73006.1 hypothetical protein [Glycine soja]UBY46649.1 hypothetical protein [Glycine max]UBY46651.1 hypothetical protein [Glycine max]